MTVLNCRACGKPIVFIKTPRGKSMPCDAYAVPYCADANAAQIYIKRNGETVHGTDNSRGGPNKTTGLAYAPHWATCTKPNQFRRAR